MMAEELREITLALKMYIQKLCVYFDDKMSHISWDMSENSDKVFMQVLRHRICSSEVCLELVAVAE